MSSLNGETHLKLNQNTLLRWKKTKTNYTTTGIYSLILEYSDSDSHLSCLLGDYPNKKGWREKILADIREVADVLEIKIPAKLSLQSMKI